MLHVALLQVTQAITTEPPATFSNENDESPSPLKINIGTGPGDLLCFAGPLSVPGDTRASFSLSCSRFIPHLTDIVPLTGGGYTRTNPELRRIIPDARGRPKIKVVYVVLEAQYQSSLTAAVKNINATRPQVWACAHHPRRPEMHGAGCKKHAFCAADGVRWLDKHIIQNAAGGKHTS